MLDQIDLKILDLLQEDGSLTNKEIAARLGLTLTPIYERIKKLKNKGIIVRFAAILDKDKIGKSLVIFCIVTIKGHSEENLRKFETAIRGIPEVTECYLISGNADYILKVILENMQAYDIFLNKLSRIENISNTNSIIVVRQIKNSFKLPL